MVFNGDGYSEDWHAEAEKRGLPNLKTTPEALPVLSSPEVVKLFTTYGVFSEAELKSREEIYLEQYCKTIMVAPRVWLGASTRATEQPRV